MNNSTSSALRYDHPAFDTPDAVDQYQRRYVFDVEDPLLASVRLPRGHRSFPREDHRLKLTFLRTDETIIRRVYRVFDFRKITAKIEFYP